MNDFSLLSNYFSSLDDIGSKLPTESSYTCLDPFESRK